MDEVLSGIPAWGLFALACLWVVLNFYEKARSKLSKPPPPMPLGSSGDGSLAESVQSAIRDLQERQQVLEKLHSHDHWLQKLTDAAHQLTAAEVTQTEILKRVAAAVECIPCQGPTPPVIPIRRANGSGI